MLDKDDWELLGQISNDLRLSNSDLARLILHQELSRINALKASNYSLSITGQISGDDNNGKCK